MTMQRTAARDEQFRSEYVRDDADRVSAAIVIRDAFPVNLKRWGSARFGLSRARNASTDNPLLRLRIWIRRGRRVGMTRELAMLLVVDLLAVIEQEWGAPVAFDAAAIAEQSHDGREDDHQVMSLVDRAHLPEYVRAAKAHVATELVAIAAAERELAAQLRAA